MKLRTTLPLLAFSPFAAACTVALILPTQSTAQATLAFGGGVMIANLSVEPDDDFEAGSRTGIFVGANLGIPLTDVVSLNFGGVYTQKGGTFSAEVFGDQIDLDIAGDYLSVPVTLEFALVTGGGAGLSIFAGPTFGIEVKCEVTLSVGGDSGSGSCEDGATAGGTSVQSLKSKSLDVGAVVGAVGSFPAGESARIFVNGGYNLGLTNVEDNMFFTSAKNRALFVGAGLAIPLGDD